MMPRGRPPLSVAERVRRKNEIDRRRVALNMPNVDIKVTGLADCWMEVGYVWSDGLRFALKHVAYDPRDIDITESGLYVGGWFYPRIVS